MRELMWAANAVQRAEWDRFAQLLNLVDTRTLFGDGAKPVPFEKWYPIGMITKTELKAAELARKRAKDAKVIKVPFSVIRDIALGANGRK